MQTFAIARLLLLFIHVTAFALALGCVAREDARLLAPGPIDPAALRSATRIVGCALAVLWASGAALILLDTQAALGQLLEQPKLLAKVTVVVVLTANGVALHTIAFPTLLGQRRRGRYAAAVAAALGSLSAASWLAATLLGIARGPAARFQYLDFMAAYAALLGAALAFGLLCVRPRIVHKLRSGVRPFERRGSPGADVPRIQ